MNLTGTIRSRPGSVVATSPHGWATAEQLVAFGALMVLPIQRLSFGPGVMPRHAVFLLLIPMWWPVLSRYRGARLFMLMGAASVLSGLILAEISSSTHRFSRNQSISTTLDLVGFLACFAIILWSRSRLSTRQIGLGLGLGLALNSLLGTGALGASNALKFGWTLPICILLLAALSSDGKLGRQVCGLLALAGLALITDARSLMAICVLAAVLTAWQMRPVATSRRSSWVWTALMILALGAATYNIGSALLVDGYLGDDAQAKSAAQVGAAGSLILGGRPELAATATLFLHRPWGFGAGIGVTQVELDVAKRGMESINYDPDNGYVERYMFGPYSIELHSVVGDVWASFGLVGLAFILIALGQIIKNISLGLSRRQSGGLVTFATCLTLWNMFFSPFYTSLLMAAVCLGLLLPTVRKAAEPAVVLNANPATGGPARRWSGSGS